MRKMGLRVWLAVAILMMLVGRVEASELYKLSLAEGVLRHNEGIVSFVLRVRFGSIRAMSRIPSMWEFNVSNYLSKEPAWHTRLDGAAGVVAGALTRDEMNALVLIEKEDEGHGEALEIDLVIHTFVSGTEEEAERHLTPAQVFVERVK